MELAVLKISGGRWLRLLLWTALVLMVTSAPAFAQTLDMIDNALENIVEPMTGNTARLIAIIAVATFGIICYFGNFPVRYFFNVLIGTAVIFSAAEFVDAFIV